MSERYRGWLRPGPVPPGGLDPQPGETLDYLCGHYRIFQYEKGHRYSTDDVLTAWYGTQWAPRVERCADLGSGIGSVVLIAAWRLPAAHFCTVEAQPMSARLQRKSIRYNGLESRFTVYDGDLRDAGILKDEAPFDLVLGSPPYWPPGTAAAAEHEQAVPARNEVRGSVADYAAAAARILGPGGIFAFVFPAAQSDRVIAALAASDLVLIRSREVIFKEAKEHSIALFAAARKGDLPRSYTEPREGKPVVERPLTIRRRDGSIDPEYAAIRLSFGFPPGDMGPED
jgi:tRNA1Val (adenine37-N6)-methyltransferase